MAYDDWFSYRGRERGYGAAYRPARRAAEEGHHGRDWSHPDPPRQYRGDPWRAGLWRDPWPFPGEQITPEDRSRRQRAAPAQGYGREYIPSPRRSAPRHRVSRELPPDYRRYLSREEYGLDESWSQYPEPGRPGASRRSGRGPIRFTEGVLGPRNALFGREGFRRYDGDYEQWW